MVHRARPGLSPAQRRELWRRWRDGESLSAIGRALGKRSGSVFSALASRGGIGPAARTRSRRSLGLGEREEISRDLASGVSLRQIAARLGRAPSTISREVTRNDGRARYRAAAADARAWARAARPRPCLLASNPSLRAVVAEKLGERWSPQQVAGWLKAEHGRDEAMRVSHETIYKSLFIQARGVLKRELLRTLRSGRSMRRARTSTTPDTRHGGQTRGQIVGAVSVRQRPAEVEDRAVPGHWEGDLIAGTRNSHIATLVERQSRFVVLVRLGDRQSGTVVDALISQIKRLPDGLRASLTWDRGKELSDHARLTMATDVAVYFCDPRSPWQRGSNENTNGLLRQYFPRRSDLAAHSQADLDAVALQLNTRPRKTLGFQTPGATFAKAVASIG